MNPQQAENLRVLIRHMETKVARTLDMSRYFNSMCNTPACAYGEACMVPELQAQGLKTTPEQRARMAATRKANNPPTPLAERFESKVDRNAPNGCHQWLGAIRAHGYGHIFLSVEAGKTKTELAHRVAWMLAGNELPEWPLVIDHTCKNMGCVNVAHLRVVTQKVNSTENSNSPHGINSRKTHCIRGHEFTPENVGKSARGGRSCKACRRKGGRS